MVHLPQLDRLFLTDAGLESDMIFNRGIDLPCFSSLMLLTSDEGRAALELYFRDFIALAQRSGTGLVLETATWRASSDWADKLGLSQGDLDRLNRDAVTSLVELSDEYPDVQVVVSGCIGPRGDGYDPGTIMTRDDADRLSFAPGRDARRRRRSDDLGADHDQHQRSHRHRPRRASHRPPCRNQLHGRNRRPPAHRRPAGGRHRGGRRGHR